MSGVVLRNRDSLCQLQSVTRKTGRSLLCSLNRTRSIKHKAALHSMRQTGALARTPSAFLLPCFGNIVSGTSALSKQQGEGRVLDGVMGPARSEAKNKNIRARSQPEGCLDHLLATWPLVSSQSASLLYLNFFSVIGEDLERNEQGKNTWKALNHLWAPQ